MFIIKIENQISDGGYEFFWQSEPISQSEINKTLPVLLKNSLFGVTTFRIIIERV